MTETPKCPYCGEEMTVMAVRIARHNWIGWCNCENCLSVGPSKSNCYTEEEAKEVAASAALHCAEPEMRPLTLEEVRAHCAKGPDAEPLWAEYRKECAISRWIFAVIPPDVFDRPVLSEWIATNRSEKYGKEWRCWPRKPTPEQMAAWKWEEDITNETR